MRPADTLGAGRGTTVVCLMPDPAQSADNAAALWRLVEVTPADVSLLLLGVDRQDRPLVSAAERLERQIRLLQRVDGEPVSRLLHRAAAATAPADLVLVRAGCRLPAGWLERLRGAARSDSAVATATPISGDDGPAGVPGAIRPDPDRLVAAAAIRARPRLQIGGPHCVYLRREAIELVGGLMGGLAGGLAGDARGDVGGDVGGEHDTVAATIAAFCERCGRSGLVNVLADDVFVSCPPSLESPQAPSAVALMNLDRCDERSALRRSLALASSVLTGVSVTIDARSLDSSAAGGTQRYTRELILAMARHTDLALRVVVGPDIAPGPAAELAEAGGVQLITYEQAVSGVATSHVVHRPQQVSSPGDLNLLALLGRRVMITHQDLIAYHNPAYHETFESWEQYRRITRIGLAAADRVLFFSEHSLGDAEAEDLVTRDRCEVVGAAIAAEAPVAPLRPRRMPAEGDFLLCLGPDYRHKNRRFAIALLGALRAQHGWPGQLVLAGAHVPHGSSRPEEDQLLAEDADLRGSVIDLGSVDERGRAWLMRQARAIVVPSVVEGFGLVPLEAAQAGVPCLFAPQSSLVEVMDRELATLVAWDEVESARRVMPLLRDGEPRRRHLTQQRAAAARWRWETIAGELAGAYERALRAPYRAAAPRAWQELERELYLVSLDRFRRRYNELGDSVALAGRGGFLTAREQRGLLRVGSRPPLARLTLWPFALLGRSEARPGAGPGLSSRETRRARWTRHF